MSFIGTASFGASNLSAFGDFLAQESVPLLQIDWIYGANTQIGTLANTGDGSGAPRVAVNWVEDI